jgi:hypothetical protein
MSVSWDALRNKRVDVVIDPTRSYQGLLHTYLKANKNTEYELRNNRIHKHKEVNVSVTYMQNDTLFYQKSILAAITKNEINQTTKKDVAKAI